MTNLLKKNKELVLYIVFGILTTVVNVVSYTILIFMNVNVQISVIISWIFAILFAYLTNKLWVFSSQFTSVKKLILEFASFMGSRVVTLGLEMIIIWYGVQYMHQNPIIWKIIDNVFVVIINYIFSKLIIFKDR